jgi:MFS family permease
MAVVDVARVLVTGALALAVMAGTASLTMLYAAAFLSGVGSMIRDTAASTALPRLVPDRQLDVANGRLVAGSLVGGELAGPAVGGALFGLAAALPLATNAASLALAVLLICTLPDVFAPLPPEQDSSGSTVLRTLCGEIYTGMAWLWRDRQLRRLTAATSLVFIADGAFLGVLVLYVTEILREPPGIYGILLGVGAIGGILGGLTCARLARRFGSAGVLVITVVAMAAAQLIVGFTSDTLAAAAAMTVSSAAFAVLNVIARTLRQRRSPSALLGRVTAGYLTVIRGAEAGGALLGGVIATAGGIRAPILAGVPMLLMGAVLLRRPT